jgi:hypothetical protein
MGHRLWEAGGTVEGQRMAQKHHKPEEIVAKLRQVEVLTLWDALGDLAASLTPTECANNLRNSGYFQSA